MFSKDELKIIECALTKQQSAIDKNRSADYVFNTTTYGSMSVKNRNLLESVRKKAGINKYKEKWEPNQLNKKYWEEVLVGRTIAKIKFNKNGIDSLILDNGEKVMIRSNTLCIKVAISQIKNP